MRHALITTHLLNQAHGGGVAQAEADHRWQHQAQAMPRTSRPRRAGSPGSSPWPAASAPWRHGLLDRRKEGPMRVLVTGGTGFVGCHTVAALVDQGGQVRPDGLRQPPASARSPPGR